jgi:hypothetical protein
MFLNTGLTDPADTDDPDRPAPLGYFVISFTFLDISWRRSPLSKKEYWSEVAQI